MQFDEAAKQEIQRIIDDSDEIEVIARFVDSGGDPHVKVRRGDAAWFDSDDGRASFNVGAQSGQRLLQRGFGLVEHAEVIERTPAAKGLLRNSDLISGVFQDFHGGFGDFRMEVVAERIRPKDHLGSAGIFGTPMAKP